MEQSKEAKRRYSRQVILPELGAQGQEKLKHAKVLVVGAGGLGCPALQYLVAAGVGTLGIVDDDVVDISNLQRQILYRSSDVGRKKVAVAAEQLRALNPLVTIHSYPSRLSLENAEEIISQYDIVADGTDNFATRYLVNDVCVLLGKTNVFASIFKFQGQLSVFNHLEKDGSRGPNYRDLFPNPPAPGEVPSCAEAGVIGALPGIMGSLQAMEVIKVICGMGEIYSSKLYCTDILGAQQYTLNIEKDPKNPLNKSSAALQDLAVSGAYCEIKNTQENMKSITVSELAQWKEAKKDFQLIDVREEFEFEITEIGGELIPLATVPQHVDKISKEKEVVVHCRSGKRSADAIAYLESEHGFTNLYNLEGGILAYADEIDDSLERY